MDYYDGRIIEKLNVYLDKNLDNHELSIDLLCQNMGISRSQLHRILIEETQLSTTLYVRKRRLAKVKTLLKQPIYAFQKLPMP